MIKILNKNKNNKGSLAIEIVMGCLIFLILLCFLTDIAILTWKFNVISQTNTYLARTIGIQSGVKSSTPDNYPGGSIAYATSSEIYENISKNLNSAGIPDNMFEVRIGGVKFTRNSNITFDYQKFISTEIIVNYKWDMISNFIPGNITNKISSKRSVVSEYKERYDSWIGE